MREWLRETHGTQFELLRHFLCRFFDSDLVTAPGQASATMIAVVSLCLPWFQLIMAPLREKYAHLSALPVPGPYRDALRADELWLITLMMSVIGLLTAVKWQSLFPDLRDYRVLGPLPLRARQIFLAKLLALLLVAAAALALLNLVPSVGFPALAASRWGFRASPGALVGAYAESSIAGCAFCFFGLIALQGTLLNVLRPRSFGSVTGYLQGFLVALMLGLIVMSFSIQPAVTSTVVRPVWSRWLPPVWFLGMCQSRSGNPDPLMKALTGRAQIGVAIAASLALLSYLVSYQRHRTLLVEGASGTAKESRSAMLPAWMIRDPRQLAVVGFMVQTLARSSRHRVILMGYGGLAFAVLLSGLLGMGTLADRQRAVASGFIYFHVVTLLFLLMGARHLFSLPTELKANWLFQINESGGRATWLSAIDRFVLLLGALALVAPLPLEIAWLGWRGAGESILAGAVGLLAYDWWFTSWNKLPFTCSHLPGKTPGWIRALQFFGVILLGPLLTAALLAIVDHLLVFGIITPALIALCIRVRWARLEGWPDVRLQYEEAPEPAIHGLSLMR